ncbi:MAG: ribose 5-phosphate isomerase B [bacterium]|nr:ribose 5-phosphate isomerase B [bacterium]
MRLAFGSDHAGYGLKQVLATRARAAGHEVVDVGCDGPDRCDYPVFAGEVARMLADARVERGILVCGSGIGMSIAANRYSGIRAALVSEPVSARLSRAHNDANVLCLGARLVGEDMALAILDAFLGSAFESGRHADRLLLIDPPTPAGEPA